jgi:hypothetical protein
MFEKPAGKRAQGTWHTYARTSRKQKTSDNERVIMTGPVQASVQSDPYQAPPAETPTAESPTVHPVMPATTPSEEPTGSPSVAEAQAGGDQATEVPTVTQADGKTHDQNLAEMD